MLLWIWFDFNFCNYFLRRCYWSAYHTAFKFIISYSDTFWFTFGEVRPHGHPWWQSNIISFYKKMPARSNYRITKSQKCQREGVLEEEKYERVIYVLEIMKNAWVQSHRKEGFFLYKSGGIYNPSKVNLTAKHVMWAVNRS